MDITGLKYFIAAALHLNFTKAANECHITQTAMSLHIAKLEEELNFKLFHRNNRKVTLTNGGRVFLEEAQKITRDYKAAIRRSVSASLGYEGMIKIGFTNYFERISLPQFIRAFHERYPKIEIIINQNEHWMMIDEIKYGNSDVALVLPYEFETNLDIGMEKVASFNICAVVSKDHPFAALSEVPADMLKDETVIIIGAEELPSIYKRMWRDWTKFGLEPKSILETKSLDSILLMVESGFGIALLPSYIGEIHNKNLEFVNLAGEAVTLDTSLVYSKSNENPALKLFLDVLKEIKADEEGF